MRGYATGAVDYLFKPIDPEVLRAKAAVFVELYVKNRLLEDQREQLARKTAELEQSNADLEQFTYIASHDLQEPLRVMAGYLELIADTIGEALDDRARGWFDRTHDAAARMSDLLQNLLIYARAGAGAPERVPVPLGAALNAAIEHLSAAIQQAGADVRTPAELPSVPGSMRELTQVFQSVLSNALRYRSDRPLAVDVSARIDGDDVIVTVADNGRGVPPDQLERVFGLFEQVEGHPYPGSGLGLAICRKLVGRLGGRIWMEPNDGGGVRVHVLLPCGPG